MKTYSTLLNDFNECYWEDLIPKEKEMLINGHVESKPTVIPQEVQFQKAILNTLNVNLEKISHDDLLEEFMNVRNYLFQAIKEDTERDLEKKWLEKHKERNKKKKINYMFNEVIND